MRLRAARDGVVVASVVLDFFPLVEILGRCVLVRVVDVVCVVALDDELVLSQLFEAVVVYEIGGEPAALALRFLAGLGVEVVAAGRLFPILVQPAGDARDAALRVEAPRQVRVEEPLVVFVLFAPRVVACEKVVVAGYVGFAFLVRQRDSAIEQVVHVAALFVVKAFHEKRVGRPLARLEVLLGPAHPPGARLGYRVARLVDSQIFGVTEQIFEGDVILFCVNRVFRPGRV